MAILLIDLVRIASTLLSLLIIARAVLSWFSPDPGNAVVRLVHQVTEPVLAPVRNLLPAPGGMDFSPILVLIGVQVVEQVLIGLLVGMA